MKPIQVHDVDIAFGGDIDILLPPMNEIPEEFRKRNSKWNDVVSDWMFGGLKDCQWKPKEGIDTKEAIRHIQAVLVSFKPKHEHKEAGCAYLLSQFFVDVKYTREK